MKLQQILTPTKVARPGMKVRELFDECTRIGTPGLPFCDSSERVVGRVTMKNIFKHCFLPDFMIELASVLGEQLSHMQDMDAETNKLLDSPVDSYVRRAHILLPPDAPIIKALAMMEKYSTSYVFVVDEGRYIGVVTIGSLASALLLADQGI